MELKLGPNAARHLSGPTWWDLARWCKEQHIVNGFDRRFLFRMGTYELRMNGLTPRQVAHLERIFRQLLHRLNIVGYIVAVGEPPGPLLYRPCPNGHKETILSAEFCETCGASFGGPSPSAVGGPPSEKALRRSQRAADRNLYRAVCSKCGHEWFWQGTHRTARQRCIECGRKPRPHDVSWNGYAPMTASVEG